MKHLLILLFLSTLFGCEYSEPRVRERAKVELVCDKETVAYRKQFILQCINNANPHSDEEPEDWIRLCKQMAEQTYCTERTVIYIYKSNTNLVVIGLQYVRSFRKVFKVGDIINEQ